jgi:hypothetical protein
MTRGPRASRSAERTRRPVGVFEGELGGDGADGEDAVFNAGGEELGDGALADGQALGLHQVAGVGGDLVELVLQGGGGHACAFEIAVMRL